MDYSSGALLNHFITVKKFVLVVLLLSLLLVSVFVVLSSVPVAASSSIIRVPDGYQTIQEAVDAASPNDIILVSAGTYYENVRANKTISLVGEKRETTIIDNNGNRTGYVYVTADNVKIVGFTVRNGGGIFLNHSSGNIIYGNTLASNSYFGVSLRESSGNIIINNLISNNGGGVSGLAWGVGISLEKSHNNIITNNTISNNIVSGIELYLSYDNIVSYNIITNHTGGVELLSADGNIVSNNFVASNNCGISIESTRNTIEHNEIFKNGVGIGVGYSSMNVIKGNNISENTVHGIAIAHFSPNNTFVGNTISKNQNGIKIHLSNGSIIYHNNFINNTVNVPEDVYPNVNTWNDGYPSGGNYWSDYTDADFHNGPHQNLTGSDGIGDTPHTLDARNEDRFPLMGPLSFFDVGAWNRTSYNVYIASNSTISNFQLNKTQRTISFNVTGPDYTVGFCRVAIPNIIVQDLWQSNYTVLVDGNLLLMTNNWTDSTYTYIYFTYLHSEHEVVIIPEFPVTIFPPLFIIITIYAVFLRKKINPKPLKKTKVSSR